MKQPKIKKARIYTYHTSHFFLTEKGEEVSMLTQLYQIGVYAIVNNNSALQLNLTPMDIVKIEKTLKKQEEKDLITELKFGRSISVYENEEGFWTEKIES